MNLIRLAPFPSGRLLRVVVETPRDSRNKLDYDGEMKAFLLKKSLPEGMVFPYDFGFIPQTLGDDGDPLDALVLMPEPVWPGVVVDCRLIGVMRGRQKEKDERAVRNDRFIVAADTACEFAHFKTPADLPPSMLEQLEEFFINYNKLEGRTFKLLGVDGPKPARKLIEVGRKKAGRKNRDR